LSGVFCCIDPQRHDIGSPFLVDEDLPCSKQLRPGRVALDELARRAGGGFAITLLLQRFHPDVGHLRSKLPGRIALGVGPGFDDRPLQSPRSQCSAGAFDDSDLDCQSPLSRDVGKPSRGWNR
jgi:hypothetical protein